MSIQNINVGAAPNDDTGDKLRDAFITVNNNFDELDSRTTSAQATADGAQTSANAAQAAANSAQTSADAAQTAADNASSDAASAMAAAQSAADDAADANAAAALADSKAVAAQGAANDALSAANQALSTAYLRRGALPADTTHDLNNWGIAEIGVWFQSSSASATLAQNYPVATAGILEILPRTPDFGGRVTQRYTRYLDGRTYTRSQTNAGTWSTWERFDTVSERDAALAAYATTVALTDLSNSINTQLTNYAPLSGLEWLSKPIGEPFPLWDHIPGCPIPPTDNPDFRFIKLTAGDAYNSGVLTSETVTGSFPLVVATAVISLPASPINGATVQLINTSRAGMRGGSSGVLQQDAMQGHRHKFAYDDQRLTGVGSGGMVNGTIDTLSNDNVYDPITDGVNGEPRLAQETRGKNVGATYYMRIL